MFNAVKNNYDIEYQEVLIKIFQIAEYQIKAKNNGLLSLENNKARSLMYGKTANRH
jgi:hypothetical protein